MDDSEAGGVGLGIDTEPKQVQHRPKTLEVPKAGIGRSSEVEEEEVVLEGGSEELDEDDLLTPRASQYLVRPQDHQSGVQSPAEDRDHGGSTEGEQERERGKGGDLTTALYENYFPPLPLSKPSSRTSPTGSLANLSLRPGTSSSTSHPSLGTPSSRHRFGSGNGLQSKPTTAVSLAEGVHAVQQDGLTSSSRGTSITGAPSFSSDAGSLASLVPTIEAGGNDVVGMLGEILDGEENVWGQRLMGEGGLRDDGAITEDEDVPGGSTWNVLGELEDDWDDSSDEERDKDLTEEQLLRWRTRSKHFFLLSSAGKPIYTRHGNETIISGYMGVIQTIISFFQDSQDPLKSFVAGRHRFAIVREGPIYLVAISSMGESDAQLRTQLDALYNQVLSTLTHHTLSKIFSTRSNFDLRRLLGGTEVFLNGLSDAMTKGDPQTLLAAIECIKLRKHHRQLINTILVNPKSRPASLLYGLIIADSRLVSVVRPKRHSLHPPDLQILFSMLFNAATFRDGGEHWTPVCLPKFNNKGYLYAYINFFRPEICLVLISAEKDSFFELRGMKETILLNLENTTPPVIPIIEATLTRNRYTVAEILPVKPPPNQQQQLQLQLQLQPPPPPPITITHFLYRSRQNIQFTMPSYEPYFTTPLAKRKLLNIYQRLHAAVHARNCHLGVHHVVGGGGTGGGGGGWAGLSWSTPVFELYVVGSVTGGRAGNVGTPGPGGKRVGGPGKGSPSHSAQIRATLAQGANRIVKWVRREEERLFVIGGAVF